MKESEAIRHLERHHEFLRNAWKPHPDHECLDSICMAIAALRKQVPQKPKHELIKYGRHSWVLLISIKVGTGARVIIIPIVF